MIIYEIGVLVFSVLAGVAILQGKKNASIFLCIWGGFHIAPILNSTISQWFEMFSIINGLAYILYGASLAVLGNNISKSQAGKKVSAFSPVVLFGIGLAARLFCFVKEGFGITGVLNLECLAFLAMLIVACIAIRKFGSLFPAARKEDLFSNFDFSLPVQENPAPKAPEVPAGTPAVKRFVPEEQQEDHENHEAE